jgi:hypothetical protein
MLIKNRISPLLKRLRTPQDELAAEAPKRLKRSPTKMMRATG